MLKHLLLVAVVAACGSKAKPAPVKPAEPAPAPVEAAPAEPAPPSSEVLAAAALAEQYGVGKEVYVKACASCHGDNGEGNAKNPAIVGGDALPEKSKFKKTKLRKKVTFTTAKDVFDFIKAKMPLDKPGSLSEDEYLAVLAWDLNENKIAMEKKLTVDDLAAIKLR
ncbi:MAG: cytochrome c [Deltaproteobacteria bacterium]|nr:cytochrome c [Deltaproteobacteria bacterium]